jgi:hypothetical protein
MDCSSSGLRPSLLTSSNSSMPSRSSRARRDGAQFRGRLRQGDVQALLVRRTPRAGSAGPAWSCPSPGRPRRGTRGCGKAAAQDVVQSGDAGGARPDGKVVGGYVASHPMASRMDVAAALQSYRLRNGCRVGSFRHARPSRACP